MIDKYTRHKDEGGIFARWSVFQRYGLGRNKDTALFNLAIAANTLRLVAGRDEGCSWDGLALFCFSVEAEVEDAVSPKSSFSFSAPPF